MHEMQEKVGVIPGSGRSPEEGNGSPLRYSCLENSVDRGAWQATVHGVTKSRTCSVRGFLASMSPSLLVLVTTSLSSISQPSNPHHLHRSSGEFRADSAHSLLPPHFNLLPSSGRGDYQSILLATTFKVTT